MGDIRTKIRDLLGAFMFGGEASDKKVGVLSGGERTRLAMIKLLLEPVNLLILDEPTNHLDMRSKDVLKEAIRTFDGTAIIVSHDREFLDGLVTKVYEFGEGQVKEHLYGIYEFLEKKKIATLNDLQKNTSFALSSAGSPSGTTPSEKAASKGASTENLPAQKKRSYEEQKERSKRLRKLEKQVSEYEKTIEHCEAAVAILEVQMATLEGSSDKVLHEKHQKMKQQLDKAVKEWDASSTELEDAQR
jgi:ATP-binding cassette subfamily F protein 3